MNKIERVFVYFTSESVSELTAKEELEKLMMCTYLLQCGYTMGALRIDEERGGHDDDEDDDDEDLDTIYVWRAVFTKENKN